MVKNRFLIVIFVIAAAVGAYIFMGTDLLGDKRVVLSSNTAQNKPEEKAAVKPQLSTQELTTGLDATMGKYPNLNIGVAVTDLSNGQRFVYGETAPFEAASITKVLTAVTLLNLVEDGKYSLNKTLGTSGKNVSALLASMIEVSDNTAWETIDLTISYAAIRAYAAEVGLASYSSRTNTLSVDDTALMLQKLYSGQLLNKANTDLLLGHMAKANNKYIGTDLGSSYTIYHKSGYLEDRLMDSAVVKSPTGTYVLVIFSKTRAGAYDFTAGKTLFNEITASVNAAIAGL